MSEFEVSHSKSNLQSTPASNHFNSSEKSSSHGFETYYLDNHDDVAVKKVENLENGPAFGSDEEVRKILIDLVVSKTVETSKALAKNVHAKITRHLHRFKMKDRGMKAGLFYVLALSKRPGLLIEGGFLSNRKELATIASSRYQISLADAVVQGVDDFVRQTTKPPLF